MKVKNMNRSAERTKRRIKAAFAEMLAEYKEISRISVSELCARADISRGTFYTHYDDTYGVAQDYENELIDRFFDNARLLEAADPQAFADIFFQYIRENDENYKRLCRSNELLFAAKKLTTIATNKFLELCLKNPAVRDREYLSLEIAVFVEGLLCEYVKYCRGLTDAGLDDLYAYSKRWIRDFTERRFRAPEDTPPAPAAERKEK